MLYLTVSLKHTHQNDSRNNPNYDIDYCKAQDDKDNWQGDVAQSFRTLMVVRQLAFQPPEKLHLERLTIIDVKTKCESRSD